MGANIVPRHPRHELRNSALVQPACPVATTAPALVVLRASRPVVCPRNGIFAAPLTCLISSGHFNLGERPRLLQLNNTAA
ncbi:hypothetical protein, partial [Burkholderia pseudomallei]|uniref:hypothetical protein n=1 Tax=Burkholderia pseudomallei TaxID=28450 RepID=UPI001C82AD46